ncbi:MAG: hypothetical protein WC423_26285 [Vulcanimicrobiota bacterium]
MTPQPAIEHPKPCVITALAANSEQTHLPLKKLIKDKDLKKQHHDPSTWRTGGAPLVRLHNNDDEPLHKICLKGLREHGVSQRVSRKLCNDHNHELILSVLKTAPHRPGIQNLAAYIVSEIQDGGYEQSPKQKNGHQLPINEHPSDRSNYAHITTKKVNSSRHNTVKPTTIIDAPIAYRSAEETKSESQALEEQKRAKEQEYQEKSRQLGERFKALPQDLQFRLKLVASVHLSKLVPATGKREQMLKDKTFRRLANRAVLEEFFKSIDRGLDDVQALHRLESLAAA